ncbi:U3 small nucleolar RNA-associated protein 18 homolog [Belonocnema kinseyi]|uniref:U3 small nucleolar RNA-associated protein 18 homolog n=1 Tax=Belonocnema kinseyi TaxID=2817044 RepID=UPI00143D283F|nr:U3 small nucleolar RNA-associated protein 18 homolog [Belonocnema kinseyi]
MENSDAKKSYAEKRKLSLDDASLNNENDSLKKPAVSSNKGRKNRYNPELEARLEREVFGDATDVIQNLLREENSKSIKREEIPVVTTRSDDSESDNNFHFSDSEDQEECDSDASDSKHIKEKAWIDEDDDRYSVDKAFNAQNRKLPDGRPENKYSELLHNKFSDVFGTPKWADLKKDEDADSEESDSEILKHSSHKVAPKSKKLRKGTIELKAVTDINRKTHNEGPYITSVQFHPTSTVGLVAGSSGVLSLFEIDGRENSKLHSLKFQRFPISAARFLKEGTQIVAGSLSHAHCFTYDLMSGSTRKTALPHGITNMKKFEVSPDEKYLAICGRLGEIHILSSITKELIRTIKMNKKCNALAFTPDSQKLITHGESTEMYVWDMRNQSCMHRAIDDGCLSAASIAISASGQFLATGSKQGVVNVYDTNSVLQKKSPTPLKILLNLVTSITSLKFNPTSEMLAVSSSKKANAFKLMHLPSFTVFSNFPTFQTKMYNPLALDFSPGSGFLSVANNKNHAYLYRLKHYGNY